ncbi:DUF362 domain-containing protein, partial [Calditrichota bacterium]
SCAIQNISQKSKVVISRDSDIILKSKSIDSDKLMNILDNGIQAFFNVDNPVEGWKKVVKPGEVIGLKVNCLSGPGSTHTLLVDTICEMLLEAGIKAENIIIWDRQNSDLEDGKFKIRSDGKGIKCLGNDVWGFENNFEMYGSSASLVCQTLTRVCDGIINLPVLRDHGIAGITMALKNMFGAIHNPNKFHLNVGDPYIADVFSYPSIKNKVRLTIADAIFAQYEGGPSFMPHWRWPYAGLIIGKDPVALDCIGWQIIEDERKKKGLKSLKEIGREPTYIATAADQDHLLGTNDPKQIEVINV